MERYTLFCEGDYGWSTKLNQWISNDLYNSSTNQEKRTYGVFTNFLNFNTLNELEKHISNNLQNCEEIEFTIIDNETKTEIKYIHNLKK